MAEEKKPLAVLSEMDGFLRNGDPITEIVTDKIGRVKLDRDGEWRDGRGRAYAVTGVMCVVPK
jgi:hypothetical protein